MKYTDLGFNPKTDIAPVDQFGFVDLRQAYLTHSIDGDTAVADDAYNGIDDPDNVGAMPDDVFAAYRMRDSIVAAEAAKQSKPQGNEPAGE